MEGYTSITVYTCDRRSLLSPETPYTHFIIPWWLEILVEYRQSKALIGRPSNFELRLRWCSCLDTTRRLSWNCYLGLVVQSLIPMFQWQDMMRASLATCSTGRRRLHKHCILGLRVLHMHLDLGIGILRIAPGCCYLVNDNNCKSDRSYCCSGSWHSSDSCC